MLRLSSLFLLLLGELTNFIKEMVCLAVPLVNQTHSLIAGEQVFLCFWKSPKGPHAHSKITSSRAGNAANSRARKTSANKTEGTTKSQAS